MPPTAKNNVMDLLPMTNKLTIVQHNVRHWKGTRGELTNIYLKIDPDIILINSHGVAASDVMKIFGYDLYRKNDRDELHNGCAIAINKRLKYRIHLDYHSDLLSAVIETNLGPVEIATDYCPPRRGYLHYPDYFKLFRKRHPVYFLGDLNARSPTLG